MKLGLYGLAGSGKDTAAEIIHRVLLEQGMHFEIVKYAGLLKEATRQAFGEDFDDRVVKEEQRYVDAALGDRIIDATDYVWIKLGLPDELFEEYNRLTTELIDTKRFLSPREFQQILGTDVVRKLDPDAWVNYLHRKDGNYIISDCRFGNEMTDFTALLMRHDAPTNLHESERFTATLMHDVFFGNPDGYFHDYTLWNTGTIEELERNIRFMLTTIDFSDYQ